MARPVSGLAIPPDPAPWPPRSCRGITNAPAFAFTTNQCGRRRPWNYRRCVQVTLSTEASRPPEKRPGPIRRIQIDRGGLARPFRYQKYLVRRLEFSPASGMVELSEAQGSGVLGDAKMVVVHSLRRHPPHILLPTSRSRWILVRSYGTTSANGGSSWSLSRLPGCCS
jgi:hypothetical protein